MVSSKSIRFCLFLVTENSFFISIAAFALAKWGEDEVAGKQKGSKHYSFAIN
jgi:hypothetical protein